MDIEEDRSRAEAFRVGLSIKRQEVGTAELPWYPYDSLSNFGALTQLLTGNNRQLFGPGEGLTVADIGAADGDTAFFLETLGYEIDIVDHAPTNYNGLRGARALKDALQSAVSIYDVDLDAQSAQFTRGGTHLNDVAAEDFGGVGSRNEEHSHECYLRAWRVVTRESLQVVARV